MKSYLIFTLFFIIFLGFCIAGDLSFHGSIKNSIYSYESDQSHTRFYQYGRFDLSTADNRLSLQTSMRVLTDANETLADEYKYRLYSLKLGANDLVKNLDITLGRQFLHPGTILGALDGLNINYDLSQHLGFQLYGGVESHFQRDLKIYEFVDSFVSGGLLQIQKLYSSKLQLLYLRKANKEDVFWNIAGLNFDSKLIPKTLLRVQTHYDMENARIHRLLLSARNFWSKKFASTVEYKQQQPQVYANSYFTIFEPLSYQRMSAGLTYEFIPNYFVEGQFQYLDFEYDSANRIFLNLANNFGSLGMVYESGYAGDQLSLMFDVYYEILQNLLASLVVDYSKYRVEKVYEYDNQLANAARLSYRFSKHWYLDVEYQWLTNRFKSQDSRFLNHIAFKW